MFGVKPLYYSFIDDDIIVGSEIKAILAYKKDAVITNEAILFAGATMPVEEGFLMGFDEEISGFEDAVMFAPMIGTIPFVGYVFDLAEDADVEAFVTTLQEHANMRWNICTEAEQTVTASFGDKVFFMMCKKSAAE